MASPKNLFGRSLSTEVCDKDVVYCGLLESISDEPKNIADDQNVVLSLNMDLKMLYVFSFKSSEGLFERFEKMITFFVNDEATLFCLSYKSLFELAKNC